MRAGRRCPADINGRDNLMKSSWLVVLLALALGGCFSFSSSDPPPPSKTTIVVPQGSTATCSPSPCQ
jgi:hypothetical protein